MTAAAVDRAIDPPASAAPSGYASVTSGTLKINPSTGLSTDYLNHFTEAVMVVEMAAMMPECLDDLKSWRPRTYREHFERSHFADRHAIILAYETADPAVREALKSVTDTLNAVLVETRDVVLGHLGTPIAEALTQRAVAWLKPLIARAGAVINGTATAAAGEKCRLPPQASIDAIFDR
jgi:hypothetical protein